MARKLIVELIADPRGYTAGLQTAAKETKVFGAEMDKATRGILSGSGAMRGLGRSLAFASGGFLAFEGVSSLLHDSVKAAVDAGVAQRSLTAQMKTSGESFAASKDQIEQANLGLAKFGFTSEDAVHALTVLERGTGNIGQALKLETLSADLARAKNIDLASAANVVAKVFGGQETALRRAVPGLSKQAHGLDLIRLAQQRLAGQAAAGTTKSEQFAATLHDTEVIIGTALLPTLNQYLTSLTEWLDKMNQSGQLQKDVAGAVKFLGDAISTTKAVLDPLIAAFRALGTVVGGTRNELKLLAGVFITFKTLKLASSLTETAAAMTRIGTEATGAGAKVALLRGRLLTLVANPYTAAIVITAVGAEIVAQKIKDLQNMVLNAQGATFAPGSGLETTLVPRLAKQIEAMKAAGQSTKTILATLRQQLGGSLKGDDLIAEAFSFSSGSNPKLTARIREQVGASLQAAAAPHDLATHIPILGRGGLSPTQRNALALSAAGRTATTKDDLAALVTQRQLLGRAIATETARLNQATTAGAAKKFAANLQSLQDKDAAAMNEIAGIVKKGAAQAGRTGAEIAQQRNSWFDTSVSRMLDRVQDIPTLKGQISRLGEIAGLIGQRIAATKDITRKLNLEDTLAQVRRTISGDQAQQTQNDQDAKKATADRKQAAQQRMLDRLQLAVDRTQLTAGLQDDLKALQAQKAAIQKIIATQGSTLQLQQQLLAVELAINAKQKEIDRARADRKQARADQAAKAAQKQIDAANLTVAKAGLTDTLRDDLAANQKLLAVMKKTGASAIDLVNQQIVINNLKKQLAPKIADGAKADDKAAAAADQATQTTRKLFKHLNATAFVHQFGQGLTRAQKLRIETGLAMTGPGGTLPAGRPGGQFTAGITIHGGVHMHGVQDVPGLENQIAKRAKARPHVRRGARG